MGDHKNQMCGPTADLGARDGVPARGGCLMRTPLRDAEQKRCLGRWIDRTHAHLDEAEGCGFEETQHAVAEVLEEAVGAMRRLRASSTTGSASWS